MQLPKSISKRNYNAERTPVSTRKEKTFTLTERKTVSKINEQKRKYLILAKRRRHTWKYFLVGAGQIDSSNKSSPEFHLISFQLLREHNLCCIDWNNCMSCVLTLCPWKSKRDIVPFLDFFEASTRKKEILKSKQFQKIMIIYDYTHLYTKMCQ